MGMAEKRLFSRYWCNTVNRFCCINYTEIGQGGIELSSHEALVSENSEFQESQQDLRF
jgi:hypothetical protein